MIKGHSIAGTSTKRERIKNDYYATPSSATRVFLESFDLSNCKTFLEPACGEGHISKVLLNKYKDSTVKSTDLIYRNYGSGGINFLKLSEELKYDCIITNSPFKLLKEFTEKALKLSNKYVIMFAKIQFLEGIGRKEFFDKNPPKYIYVFRNRVNPLRNGNPVDENGKSWSSTMCFAWFVWEIGFKGEPRIRWLQSNIKRIKKCCFCNNEIEGFGNNARPVKDKRCCDECNKKIVIPFRLEELKEGDLK